MRLVIAAAFALAAGAVTGSAQDLIFADGFEAGSICAWANMWFPDTDEDGWGDENGIGIPVTCPPPSGYAGNGQDCADTDSGVHPLAVELCDGEDDDCDGIVDDDAYCDLGMTCCTGSCVDTDGEVEHCGECGSECDLSNTHIHVCIGGICFVDTCDSGFDDCDGNSANGCEININGNPSHCGVCGIPCSLPNTSAHACVAAECQVLTCDDDFGNCDSIEANGCEIHTGSNLDHCGACNNVCDLPHANLQACVDGRCAALTCDTGFGDCDDDPFNSCETDLSSDFNCGYCGLECIFPETCVDGECVG
jgi:hypothetical protein